MIASYLFQSKFQCAEILKGILFIGLLLAVLQEIDEEPFLEVQVWRRA